MITWFQTTWKSVSTEIIKQCFRKCGFDVGNMSTINQEIDTEFQEFFLRISSESKPDEYIGFDAEVITSELAVNLTHVELQQECRE